MFGLESTTLDHYYLQSLLARGGMSEVYLGFDKVTEQNVAIKVMDGGQSDYSQRFQREVKILSTLTHPHILPILTYGYYNCWHYLVMPYMQQGTLRELLARGPLPLEQAGLFLEQIASALQYAHDRGFIHRDIKPSNILLRNEQCVYLADFGLAKGLVEDTVITQTGCLMGTPEYMAPELAEQPASISSDIYALGILLYYMVTGRVPFKGCNAMAVYWKHIQEQPLCPTQLNPGVPRHVGQVILNALAKNPRQRFQTAQELAQTFKKALAYSPKSLFARLTPSERRCAKV